MLRFRVALLLALVGAGGPLLGQTTAVPADKAQIQVRLPATAKLTIAGDPTTQTGEVRLFESPSLQPGASYSYELVATWEKDGKPIRVKRVVPLLLGQRVLVDFTTKPAEKPSKPDPDKHKRKPKNEDKDAEKLRVPPREKPEGPQARNFRFTYQTSVTGLKPGQSAKIWVPIAASSADQKVEVVERKVPKTCEKDAVGQESRFGNVMLFVEGKADEKGQLPLKVVYRVTRYEVRGDKSLPKEEDSDRLVRFLQADALVPVGGKSLELLKGQKLPDDQTEAVRLIYNAVNNFMRYSKEGTGWGRGDVNWVCDSKYGNCTDFASLFLSLVRARKIPARFEIGFLLPAKHGKGSIPGYHCWAKFKPEGKGWIPVDVSEANQHPEMKDYYFGNLTADRITFTTGRDIDLVPRQAAGSLNYFIYPHVEVDGKEYPRDKIVNSFSYEDVK